MRSVWTFPTAQTPEAHFATFPPELPRRCISASTPKAICVKCGHARVRILETRYEPHGPSAKSQRKTTYGERSSGDMERGSITPQELPYGRATRIDTTVGWTSCDCAEPDYQPGLVLDPFAGLATTGVVALQLGRRFTGIELSEKYAELARTKLETWWKQTKIVEPEVPEGQEVLL